jgi:hypothetical protein
LSEQKIRRNYRRQIVCGSVSQSSLRCDGNNPPALQRGPHKFSIISSSATISINDHVPQLMKQTEAGSAGMAASALVVS